MVFGKIVYLFVFTAYLHSKKLIGNTQHMIVQLTPYTRLHKVQPKCDPLSYSKLEMVHRSPQNRMTNYHPRALKEITNIMDTFELVVIWRLKNPELVRYSIQYMEGD
jgi:abortive infection bacteriophage resistance protein